MPSQRLTGKSYRHFLVKDLFILLDGVPLAIRDHAWITHDGVALPIRNS
jgi:hypothetical protein